MLSRPIHHVLFLFQHRRESSKRIASLFKRLPNMKNRQARRDKDRGGGGAMNGASRTSSSAIIKMIAASGFGASMLLLPVPHDGSLHILLGLITVAVQDSAASVLPALVTATCVISALATLSYSLLTRPRGEDHVAEILLRPGLVWTILRVLGAVTAALIFLQAGPQWVWSADTGGLVLNDLMTTAFITIGLACLILPFLTEFGLMELVAGFVERAFRTLFTVPGRSAVDAVASWLGGSTAGVLVTMSQHRNGFYSGREAAVIAANFSIVSIAFAYVIVETVNLAHMFFPFYAVLILSGIACAIILPRIPPLSWKTDTVLADNPMRAEDKADAGPGAAWTKALKRAETAIPAGMAAGGKRARSRAGHGDRLRRHVPARPGGRRHRLGSDPLHHRGDRSGPAHLHVGGGRADPEIRPAFEHSRSGRDLHSAHADHPAHRRAGRGPGVPDRGLNRPVAR